MLDLSFLLLFNLYEKVLEYNLRQIQNLVDSLTKGVPLAIDGADARKAVALVCALYQSAETGRPVRVA